LRSPILAAILSLIVAGLGQIYNGQIGKGVIFIVIQLINGALTAVLIGWLLLPIVGLWATIDAYIPRGATTSGTASGSIRPMDERDLLTLQSAVTAIEEAASAVAREVERDRLRETSLARLSTIEAELNRSQLALEKIIQEETV
jgi:TM2 domain-containing membrane protein YozV